MLAKTEIMPEFDARKNAPLCSHYARLLMQLAMVGGQTKEVVVVMGMETNW